jgi:hypothetical protein
MALFVCCFFKVCPLSGILILRCGCVLETAKLNHWITCVSITTAVYKLEIRVCPWEITGNVQ